MKHHKTHSKKHKETKVESHLSLYNVAVQVVDPMTYDKRLRIMVNDVPPCSGRYIKFRVGRLSEHEKNILSFLFDKYFPTTKPTFIKRDGFYQTDIISECKINDYYVFGDVIKGTSWQHVAASIFFECHSEYCKAFKNKHGLKHNYPNFIPFPFDRRTEYYTNENKPNIDWEFVIP